MDGFNASLLREKFVIRDAEADDRDICDPPPDSGNDHNAVIALSNRLDLPLASKDGKRHEEFIVRAQNMHTCLRLGARIAQDFADLGSIINRQIPFDWHGAYDAITKGYEQKWNDDLWVAVYHKGRIIYEHQESKERHPFLDIIEQCDARNKGDYAQAVALAESAFQTAGKTVKIEHKSNVALIMNVTDTEGKCGIILRSPDKTTTFNFSARRKDGHAVKISQCLSASAAFLEAIQLAFLVGFINMKTHYELIPTDSDEARKGAQARQKIGRLNNAVSQFENMLNVTYRPERPEMASIIESAEKFSKDILSTEVVKNIADGETEGWIV